MDLTWLGKMEEAAQEFAAALRLFEEHGDDDGWEHPNAEELRQRLGRNP